VTDLILARSLDVLSFVCVGVLLAGLALYLRVRVFIGTRPGGVDTWYYLASAEAIRRQKRLPISLPQYLLHDKYESYPPVFPLFLAALPPGWLKRYFWLISPLIDCLHLLLLYLLSFRLTDSVLAAGTAGLIYAVTPQLISETRNLNGRAFASLLQTVCMIVLLRSIIPSTGPTSAFVGPNDYRLFAVAVVLLAVLFNTHTSTTIAFLVSTAVLTVALDEPRFLLAGVLGLPMAIVLSGGYYLRVIMNHVHAARFWMRNVHLTRAHQIDDSPIYGKRNGSTSASRVRSGLPSAGLYRSTVRGRLALVARLLGENPFIVAMLVTPIPEGPWATAMYWWAVAILAWCVLTTFGGPLRILGPGIHYMKASVFPTAYALAVAVNIQEGAVSFVGLAVLISLIASFAALAYFYRYMATRRSEHTASTPPDLAQAAAYLRDLPGTNVLVLPTMYADYVAYASRKAVLWGGHSGDLTQLEEFFPVIRKRLQTFMQQYAIDYIVFDRTYATPERVDVADRLEAIEQFGTIAIYGVRAAVTVDEPTTLRSR